MMQLTIKVNLDALALGPEYENLAPLLKEIAETVARDGANPMDYRYSGGGDVLALVSVDDLHDVKGL